MKTALRTSLPGLEANVRRVLIAALLYCLPVVPAMSPVLDPDLWWHLRTGQWILAHGYVPTTDPFSGYGMGRPWIDYSWLFEIPLYLLYESVGLSGILYFTVAMSLLVTFAVHLLIRQAHFTLVVEAGLVAAVLAGMIPLMSPRPWLISIVFFIAQLAMVRNFRCTGKIAPLWILPALYALWANLHIQFVYGLAVLFLLIAESVILTFAASELPSKKSQRAPIGPLLLLAAACALAVLANPYGFNVYRQAVEFSLLSKAFQSVQELQAMSFHSPADWFVLGLTAAAAFVLGAKRRLPVFPLLLFLMGCFLGFRTRRDVWVTVLAAGFVMSECLVISSPAEPFRFSLSKVLAVIGAVAIAIGFMGRYRQLSETSLRSVVAERYPVKAVDFVAKNNYRGPLFNSFNWGGYLIWSLPGIPVSIDGRGNIHADHIERSFHTWMGYAGWDSNRELMAARLVIAERTWPLTSLLRMDSRFRIVYEDGTAVVFVRNEQTAGKTHGPD